MGEVVDRVASGAGGEGDQRVEEAEAEGVGGEGGVHEERPSDHGAEELVCADLGGLGQG